MNSLKKHIGIIGLIIGFIGIATVIFEKDIAELITPKETVSAKADKKKPLLSINLGNKKISFGKSKSTPQADKTPTDTKPIRIIYSILGLCAIIAGIIAWIRKENLRICGGAVSVGLIAIAWQYVLIGIIAIAIAAILSANDYGVS